MTDMDTVFFYALMGLLATGSVMVIVLVIWCIASDIVDGFPKARLHRAKQELAESIERHANAEKAQEAFASINSVASPLSFLDASGNVNDGELLHSLGLMHDEFRRLVRERLRYRVLEKRWTTADPQEEWNQTWSCAVELQCSALKTGQGWIRARITDLQETIALLELQINKGSPNVRVELPTSSDKRLKRRQQIIEQIAALEEEKERIESDVFGEREQKMATPHRRSAEFVTK